MIASEMFWLLAHRAVTDLDPVAVADIQDLKVDRCLVLVCKKDESEHLLEVDIPSRQMEKRAATAIVGIGQNHDVRRVNVDPIDHDAVDLMVSLSSTGHEESDRQNGRFDETFHCVFPFSSVEKHFKDIVLTAKRSFDMEREADLIITFIGLDDSAIMIDPSDKRVATGSRGGKN